MATGTSAFSAGTSISRDHVFLPAALAETRCLPGSMGSGVPSTAGAIG